MKFEFGSATDTGMVREANQDRFLLAGNFAAVADGMGGHAGGELAAETAVDQLHRYGALSSAGDLVKAIQQANNEVLAAADRTGMTNMGTTVVAALFNAAKRSVVIANVGDSRAYLLTGGELDQITQDHSLVQDLIEAGKITPAEARDHPHRNVVTRVLGIGPDPEVDIFSLAISEGDTILLASDGLFNEVDHQALATILANAENLDIAAQRLVERANQNGGNDNITVVIVRAVDDSVAIAEPQSATAIAGLEDKNPTQQMPITPGPTDSPAAESGADPAAEGSMAGLAVAAGLAVPAIGEDRDESGSGEHGPIGGSGNNAKAGVTDDELDARGERESDDYVDTVVIDTDPGAGAYSDVGSASNAGSLDDSDTNEVATAGSGRRSRKLRAFVFILTLITIGALSVGALFTVARSGWFVQTEANELVIFRGRPDGFLFIPPLEIESTGIDLNDLDSRSRRLVSEVPTFTTLEEAQAFIDQLELSPIRSTE